MWKSEPLNIETVLNIQLYGICECDEIQVKMECIWLLKLIFQVFCSSASIKVQTYVKHSS